MTGRAYQAELMVRTAGDQSVEGRVQSAISKEGAIVESVSGRVAPNGSREQRIVLAFERYRSLDEIVRAIGGVMGAAVTSVTLLPAPANPGRSKEAL